MGRKSLEVINQERKALGLPFRKRKKSLYKKKVKSNAINEVQTIESGDVIDGKE